MAFSSGTQGPAATWVDGAGFDDGEEDGTTAFPQYAANAPQLAELAPSRMSGKGKGIGKPAFSKASGQPALPGEAAAMMAPPLGLPPSQAQALPEAQPYGEKDPGQARFLVAVMVPSGLATPLSNAFSAELGVSAEDTVAEVLAIPHDDIMKSINDMQIRGEDGSTRGPRPIEKGKVIAILDKARKEWLPVQAGQMMLPPSIYAPPPAQNPPTPLPCALSWSRRRKGRSRSTRSLGSA